MTGEQLYQSLISKRDYSGNTEDKYAQELQTIFTNLFLQNQSEQFYELLQAAQEQQKRLLISPAYLALQQEIFIDEITVDDLVIM